MVGMGVRVHGWPAHADAAQDRALHFACRRLGIFFPSWVVRRSRARARRADLAGMPRPAQRRRRGTSRVRLGPAAWSSRDGAAESASRPVDGLAHRRVAPARAPAGGGGRAASRRARSVERLLRIDPQDATANAIGEPDLPVGAEREPTERSCEEAALDLEATRLVESPPRRPDCSRTPYNGASNNRTLAKAASASVEPCDASFFLPFSRSFSPSLRAADRCPAAKARPLPPVRILRGRLRRRLRVKARRRRGSARRSPPRRVAHSRFRSPGRRRATSLATRSSSR